MEGSTTFPNSPNYSSQATSSSNAIYFCSICDKPFTSGRKCCESLEISQLCLTYWTESSRDRHLPYCGSRTRNRPRSCRSCNAAKTKCSFETPCSRCTKKAIECVYDESATAAGKRALPVSSAARRVRTNRPSTSHADDRFLSIGDSTFTDDQAMDEAPQTQFISGSAFPSFDLSMQRSLLNESLTLDGLFSFEALDSSQHQDLLGVSLNPYDKLDKNSVSWCDWACRGFSLSLVTENPVIKPNSNAVAVLQTERPHAQHNANLIIQSLRSFPMMMLRRETFPCFIHSHSPLSSESAKSALPEALSTCMSIAQMFTSRTPDTKPFIWRTIKSEFRCFSDEVCTLPTRRSSVANHPKVESLNQIRTSCASTGLHDLLNNVHH
jgi:Fungal Zn(2)-Cys(6) binuclear cluster domain